TRLRRAKWGSYAWSTAYHVVLGGAVLLGLVSATWANIGIDLYLPKNTIVTLLSATASALTLIGGFGGFERKWRANRRSRAAMQKLTILFAADDMDLGTIRQLLFKAIDEHEGLIVGDMPGPSAPGAEAQK
ncbi:MAG TPA: hypothetical protein VFE64_10155, partial [Devosia sp.]|nr:hypothetical protein [Devosia sp.]